MEKEKSKKIIDQIKKQEIVPAPKWKLNLKSYVFWVLLIGIVLLSAIFLSLAIFSVVDFDFELMRQLRLGRYIRLLIVSAPYVWLIMLVLTIVLGFFVFRKTRTGYRYNALLIASVILLVVSTLGAGAHMMKVNDRIENAFSRGPEGLHRLAPPGEEKFFNPKEGIISGKIIEKQKELIVIKNINGEEWAVSYDKDTKIRRSELIKVQGVVIVIGEETGEREFNASAIKPLKRPGEDFPRGEGERKRKPAEGRAHKQMGK